MITCGPADAFRPPNINSCRYRLATKMVKHTHVDCFRRACATRFQPQSLPGGAVCLFCPRTKQLLLEESQLPGVGCSWQQATQRLVALARVWLDCNVSVCDTACAGAGDPKLAPAICWHWCSSCACDARDVARPAVVYRDLSEPLPSVTATVSYGVVMTSFVPQVAAGLISIMLFPTVMCVAHRFLVFDQLGGGSSCRKLRSTKPCHWPRLAKAGCICINIGRSPKSFSFPSCCLRSRPAMSTLKKQAPVHGCQALLLRRRNFGALQLPANR